MYTTPHVSPERMTAEQRRSEITGILDQGRVRLRTQGNASINSNAESELGLGFSPKQSVHVHPASTAHEKTS